MKEVSSPTDVACFSVTFRGMVATGLRVGVLLTDKSMEYRGNGIKPSQAYQWHILRIELRKKQVNRRNG